MRYLLKPGIISISIVSVKLEQPQWKHKKYFISPLTTARSISRIQFHPHTTDETQLFIVLLASAPLELSISPFTLRYPHQLE